VVVQGEVVPSQFFPMNGSLVVVVQVDVHEKQVREAENLVYLVHE
jgi:hypothetical protein